MRAPPRQAWVVTRVRGRDRAEHQALEVFDPVWTALAPREQVRRLRLLIERVGYDGRDGTVTVTFRPPGIEALCRKAGLDDQEVMR